MSDGLSRQVPAVDGTRGAVHPTPMKSTRSTVVVMGGAGFIGSEGVRQLASQESRWSSSTTW